MANIHKNLKESALEEHIETELIRLHGFRQRNPETDYDKTTALDQKILMEFLLSTQAEKMGRLEETYGDALETRVIRRIDEEISRRGVIDVLRKGVAEGPVHLEMMFFRPATSLNPEVEHLFLGNVFSVIRQVKFSQRTEQSVDMVLFVNGVPLITTELKNELTGQTAQHAINQYKTDRDPREKLFSFKRCVAHFAMDTSGAYVTTKVDEFKTLFLPFNIGFELGKGNPPIQGKHKTYYVWEEAWSRESLSDLIQSFVHNYDEVKEDRNGKEYTQLVQLFPRYHQWKTVLNILSLAQDTGAGKNYLIQHSAGSGKSLTIAWLAYRLADLHTSENEKVYDSVIVLTDRRVLDKQLRNTIKALESRPGVLVTVGDKDTSSKLREALEGGAKIITSTIQKFPVIVDTVGALPSKKFALIVDEAHSSQSGETVRAVQEVLGDDDEEDWLLQQMNSRSQPGNISYFAFTATPKHETLERFGVKQPDGHFEPFSLYSMKQAIEEEFILDVLTNYTTYKTYFRLLKTAENDPTVPRSRALSTIFNYVNLHETTLEQKIEIMIAHFEQTVRNHLRGEAKAMIVTSSREAAARYALALRAYLKQHNYPYKVLAAFTDSLNIDGVQYTEASINDGVPEDNTAREFKKPEYRFLVVAEKYQTGFDEPYLCAMYVDKRLSGVQAVQTLSRLNRTARDKDQVFVLDFVNEVDDIKTAFEPYYTGTILSEATDINALNNLRSELFGLYEIGEVICDQFIALIDPDAEEIHEQANAFLDSLVNAIVEEFVRGGDKELLENEQYKQFLAVGNMFIKRYPYLAQVLGYAEPAHEKLYLLLKYLLKKMPRERKQPLTEILKYLDIDSVRVVRKLSTKINLTPGTIDVRQDEVVPGVPIEEAQDPLSQIIQDVNKRWGVDFSLDQQKTLTSMGEELAGDNELQDVVNNNVKQNAEIHFEKVYENKVDDKYDIDKKLYEALRSNKELNSYVQKKMFRYVVDKILALRDE